MSCGCDSPCGCNVVGSEYIDVTRQGDTFTIAADLPIREVDDTDCVLLAIDEETRTLTAELVFADAATEEASVELRCSENGLVGDVVIDPASTAIVTNTVDGLRVDVPPPDLGDGEGRPGDYLFFAGIGERAGYVPADGSELQRDEYPELWDALSLASVAATWTLGSDIIDGVSSASLLSVGDVIEAAGFVPGTTIVAVNSVSQIEVSTNATVTGGGELRAYPYGDGDGSSSFNVPDLRGLLPMGFDGAAPLGTAGVGTEAGGTSITLDIPNLPAHDHNVALTGSLSVTTTISGSGNVAVDVTGATDSDGSHQHDGAGANHDFLVENSAPASYEYLTIAATNVDTAGTMRFTSNGVEGGLAKKPNREANTYPGGSHDHGVTASGTIAATTIAATLAADSDITGSLGISEDTIGVADPVELPLPPHLIGRWMVHT